MRSVIVALTLFALQSISLAAGTTPATSVTPPVTVGPELSIAINASSVKSFKDWKTDKIQNVLQKIVAIKAHMFKLKAEGSMNEHNNFEKRLHQEQWNLEIAKDLGVNDYFVLYLAQLNSPDKYKEAASKLTQAELAELMESYARTLSQSSDKGSEGDTTQLPSRSAADRIK